MSTQPPVARCCGSTHLALSLVLALLTSALGCRRDSTPSPNRTAAALPPGVLATVADSPITVRSVENALSGDKASPQAILQQLVELRTLAHFAENGGLDRARLRATRRAVLARALLERIEASARSPETPTDAEISAATGRHWIDVDRPLAREVCHAVVHDERLDNTAGEALAQRLADALRSHHDCTEFVRVAQAFPVAGAKITAERLMPVTSDGRTLVLNAAGVPVDEGTPYDKEF
ncbi:MAG TPA: hypothetical protein VIV60_08530, partial [Polyangiaceae bacterium]